MNSPLVKLPETNIHETNTREKHFLVRHESPASFTAEFVDMRSSFTSYFESFLFKNTGNNSLIYLIFQSTLIIHFMNYCFKQDKLKKSKTKAQIQSVAYNLLRVSQHE